MRYLFFLSLLPIAACGGSGGPGGTPPANITPTAADIGGRAASVSFNAATGEFVAEIGGRTRTLGPLPSHDNGTFLAAIGTFDRDGMFVSQSENSTALLYLPDPTVISGGPSATVARTGGTTIPTQGTASVTGDYVGIFQAGTGADRPFAIVNGDATFEVDFGRQVISGLVSNRIARDPDTNDTTLEFPVAFVDLVLLPAVITPNGTFTTETEGGDASLGPVEVVAPPEGTYTGLIAADGTEVVAGVEVRYNFGEGGFLEVGAAAAGH